MKAKETKLHVRFLTALSNGGSLENAALDLKKDLTYRYERAVAEIDEQLETAKFVRIGLNQPEETLPRQIAEAFISDYRTQYLAEQWRS